MRLRHETCGQQPVRHCGPFVQEPAGNSLRSANDHVSKLGSRFFYLHSSRDCASADSVTANKDPELEAPSSTTP